MKRSRRKSGLSLLGGIDLARALVVQPRQLAAAAQNGLEFARFGGLNTEEVSTPYEVVSEQRIYKLRHYVDPKSKFEEMPCVLLVPPLMLTAEIYDVSPTSSGIRHLQEQGIDPWVVDFGAPEREAGGLDRTLTDHVTAVSDAVDRVRRATGRDVHLAGYSQGGMFCYQATALRRNDGIASVIAIGSPVDTRAGSVFGMPVDTWSPAVDLITEFDFPKISPPAWALRTAFRLIDPSRAVRDQLRFLLQLHDREALLVREHERRFLRRDGWVAWSGPAFRDVIDQFVGNNRMLSGGFSIDGQMVTLADIKAPIMVMIGEVDQIANPESARSIIYAAPEAEVWGGRMSAGHFGLVVGRAAAAGTWPSVGQWARWRDGLGEQPTSLQRVVDEPEQEKTPNRRHVEHNALLAAALGAGAMRSVSREAVRAVEGAIGFVGEASGQLPRLLRLEQIEPNTQISLGQLLDEWAKRGPTDELFLFEDRAHTQESVKYRIDSVVKGLVSVGVRRGQHVGVLMPTRPSALVAVAALSRLGAVVVLLRPGGELQYEAELGEIEAVITDPESADEAAARVGVPVFVLGGGAEPRELNRRVTDLERIDPENVVMPKWYQPNPGKAVDLAFIVFSGTGPGTIAKRITNHRWALSALGTASSAALTPKDTLYAVSPLYHPSGLLMSIGGAVASGARIALSAGFDPATFWEEVRRYGVTVVTYTWSQLHPLLEAKPVLAEQHHPVRLFVGAGMPSGLWRRVEQRFKPAQVLELYASTEGDAVLINLSKSKPGAKGRPLPGSAEVAIVSWDFETSQPVLGRSGFVRRCLDGNVGMLLSKVRPEAAMAPGQVMRDVFERDDAWHLTGALFKRDADGDYWLVGDTRSVVKTSRGYVHPWPIADAVGSIAGVDQAVAYRVTLPTGHQIVVVDATLVQGGDLTAQDLDAKFELADDVQRPDVVNIIDKIELSEWYRPHVPAGVEAKVPAAGGGWIMDPMTGLYVEFDEQMRSALIGNKVGDA